MGQIPDNSPIARSKGREKDPLDGLPAKVPNKARPKGADNGQRGVVVGGLAHNTVDKVEICTCSQVYRNSACGDPACVWIKRKRSGPANEGSKGQDLPTEIAKGKTPDGEEKVETPNIEWTEGRCGTPLLSSIIRASERPSLYRNGSIRNAQSHTAQLKAARIDAMCR